MDAPAVQSKRPVARREPREKPIVQDGSFYKAGNNRVPDARRVQKEANKKNIPIEIIQTEQTDEYAEAVVRAWLPDRTQYTDDVVHHQFSVTQELKALEYLEKEVSGTPIYFRGSPIQMFEDLSQPFNKNGDPILTGVGYLKLLTEMARFKNFALRDAVTKASRRAQLKLLNREWRDKDEVKAEKDEEKMVQDSINNQQKEKPQRNNKRRTVKKTKPTSKPEPKEPENVQEGELTGESHWKQIANDNTTLHIVLTEMEKRKIEINKKNILETSMDLVPDWFDNDSRHELVNFLKDKHDK